MTRAVARSLSALLLLAAACHSHDDVGKPCDKTEQCGEGMICDFHDGKGTCQEPHGHGSDGESESTTDADESTGHHHGDTAHDHDHTSTTTGTGTTDVTTGG